MRIRTGPASHRQETRRCSSSRRRRFAGVGGRQQLLRLEKPLDSQRNRRELRRWLARLLERGFKESTARLWISRIRTAYAHGIRDAAAVDTAFINFTGDSRSGFRQALRELDRFRRSS